MLTMMMIRIRERVRKAFAIQLFVCGRCHILKFSCSFDSSLRFMFLLIVQPFTKLRRISKDYSASGTRNRGARQPHSVGRWTLFSMILRQPMKCLAEILSETHIVSRRAAARCPVERNESRIGLRRMILPREITSEIDKKANCLGVTDCT